MAESDKESELDLLIRLQKRHVEESELSYQEVISAEPNRLAGRREWDEYMNSVNIVWFWLQWSRKHFERLCDLKRDMGLVRQSAHEPVEA